MSDERHEWLKQPAPSWDPDYVAPPEPSARRLASAPPAHEPPASAGAGSWAGPTVAAAVVLLVLIVSLTLVLRARNDDPSSFASGATPQPWPPPQSGPGAVPPATPTPTPTPSPGGTFGAPGTGTDPANPTTADHPIVPGVYVAVGSANIKGVPDDTALEFKVVGSGEHTRIAYVAGFGMRPTTCKAGARQPSESGITFLDDEITRKSRSGDGTQLTGVFSGLKLHVEADGPPGRVIGAFKFSFDSSKGCRGKIYLEANLQRPGQPTMYDQILQAAGP